MIVIGDVHGCYDTLMALFEKLPKDRRIVFVGDLIDRGPKSRQVVEFVRKNDYACTLGNHEQLALDGDISWFRHGGAQTIESYDGYDEQFEDDKNWFRQLPLYLVFDELRDEKGNKIIISHSSLGKAWTMDHESKEFKMEAIWNRHEPPTSPEGFYNIYGHTPQKFDPLVTDSFANVDTGVFFRGGKLTALLFPEMKVIQQDNIDEIVFKADYME